MRKIDADKLLKTIEKVCFSPEWARFRVDFGSSGERDYIINEIVNAPTIEEKPTGEWIYTDSEDKQKGYGGYCSICKCDMPIFMEDWQYKYCETSYCPNCGAKMLKGEEE